MTPQEIKMEINNSPILSQLALEGKTQEIADILSNGRTKFVHTEVGNGTVLEVLGIEVGNQLLDVLYTQPAFRYVKPLLEQGRLRIDSQMVQLSLQALVPTVLTQEQVNSLLNIAKVPDIIDHTQVGLAIKGV